MITTLCIYVISSRNQTHKTEKLKQLLPRPLAAAGSYLPSLLPIPEDLSTFIRFLCGKLFAIGKYIVPCCL
jgi:hypothetical protein